ncbi:OmpA family protein [Litoreibacter albidus]|uniref:Outer membrane protein OmpA n=1 Tax=Litoreibacter albidus TaxID=670155 RepID=A0A1H2V9P1_9RHOB|nr:OmpA family protein [Litoreibacter albidus]SDW65033.1 Outer membrane protein OmpA [Litoreibacter albidus]
MVLLTRLKAAVFHAKTLWRTHGYRRDPALAKADFERTAIIAALAFMLVCALSFIAMQRVNAPAPVAVIVPAPPPTPEPEPEVAEVALPVPTPEPIALPVVQAAAVIAPPAPAPAPAPVPAAPDCITELRQITNNATFYFGIGSAELSGADLVRLSRLGRMANACPEARIQITGHSDTTGSDLINFDISWKRADSTMNALAQLGLDITQFEPVGFGARTPLSQGGSTDDDRNRRVEFVVLRDDARN